MDVTPPPAALSLADRERLRHPLERRVARVVALLDVLLVTTVLSLLLWGTEWLETRPTLNKYRTHARILLVAVLGAPVVATYARRRRQILAQEESIRVGPAQLPELYRVLESQCRRVGIATPELYLSDGVDHTTAFEWRGRQCIILSTHDFAEFPEAFDDVVAFALAREVGSICLGHTSFRAELLRSSVAPIPFLRGPLHQITTYSCDRYGALLAPRATRALIVAACGDRMQKRVDLDAYFAQLDERAEEGFWDSIVWLFRRRVPLAHRVRELRRAGLLKAC